MVGLSRIVYAVAIVAALACIAPAAPANARSDGLLIFAAASLKNAMDAAARAYQTNHDSELRISYAGSSTLARQIERGAPADIYISANRAWMDRLADAGLLRAGSRFDLLGNTLVLIAPKERAKPLDPSASDRLVAALGPDGYLAMANTDAVPAGVYGRQALQHLGVWERLQGRIAQAENVRAALALVARGDAPLGIVYASDAAAERRVRVVHRFVATGHDPIVYPVAILARVDNPQAERFMAFLRSDAAAQIFRQWGFSPAASR